MKSLFSSVLSMSFSASFVIFAVMIARLLLSRAPKKWSYLLWAAVFFRLCCPISVRSAVSLFAVAPQSSALFHPISARGAVTVLPSSVERVLSMQIPSGNQAVAEMVEGIDWLSVVAWIWAAVAVLMLLGTVVRYIWLRRFLMDAVLVEDGVYETDRIGSPFVLGIFRPKIYVPSGVEAESLSYVLAHERFHVQQYDPSGKTLAYLLLCVHWFNPLCWLSYYLMNRDMEMRCDEYVLSQLGGTADYSDTLLHFADPGPMSVPGAMAFGESDISRRVKNALHWRSPKLWVTVLSVVVMIAVLVGCMTSPAHHVSGQAGSPAAFRKACQDAIEAGEELTIIYSDGTTDEDSNGFLESFLAIDWQGVNPDGINPDGMDHITLRAKNWSLVTFSGTDYVRFVPDRGEGGWLWWEIPEEYRMDGSLYTALNWAHEQSVASDDSGSLVRFDGAPYSSEEMEEAAELIQNRFATFGGGFVLKRLAYDSQCNDEQLRWLNGHSNIPGAGTFTEGICFLSDFETPTDTGGTGFNSDANYTDWSWWLARSPGGDWLIVDMGF